jgi:kumamolisin
MLRRKPGHTKLAPEMATTEKKGRPSRDAFATVHGAEPRELDAVVAFATAAGLDVLQTDAARRTVIVRGSTAAINKAFDVQLNDYQYDQGVYRSHDDEVKLPANIADYVETVVGLTNRKIPARHFSTAKVARKRASLDPPNTQPLTPAQVAAL